MEPGDFLDSANSRGLHELLTSLAQPGDTSVVLACVVAASAVAAVSVYHRVKPHHVDLSVPGPRRHPFIGILLHIIKVYDYLPQEASRFANGEGRTWGGPVPNFGGMTGAYFWISDEGNLRHVLQTKADNYVKGVMWKRVLGELVGDGIFAVDGEAWYLHRKIMSNMFSRNLMRHSTMVTQQKFENIRAYLDKKLLASEEQVEVDIQDIFFRATMDITCKVVFGIELDSIGKGKQHPFAVAFDELQFHLNRRFTDPLVELNKFFRILPREKIIHRSKKVIDDFAMEVIETKRRSVESRDKLGPDLLSRFLEHAKKYKDESLSNNELRDIIMNTLLAGRDTTACALSWLFFELTKHPDVVKKIIYEVESVCGLGDDANLSYDSLSKLKYTHAVAMEALRIHPSVPADPKYAVSDDILPDGTRIPGGSCVVYVPYAMGRNKRIWGEDISQFRPERFLNQPEPSPFRFSAFNGGVRLCLGKPMALMTMKLAMCFLLPLYEITDSRGHSGDTTWTLVHQMKGGFQVTVQKKA